ncbi:MAG: hypothetical protein IIX15_02850 [Clostridia bacterium]|nr:hypothetical protein [Clostridia bacterium]
MPHHPQYPQIKQGMLFFKKNKQILLCNTEGCSYSRPAPEYADKENDGAEDEA